MRRLSIMLATALLLTFADLAYSQSLADLAKKEKERREQVKTPERVITNQDAARFKATGVMTITLPAPEPPAAAKSPEEKEASKEVSGAKPEKPESDEPVDFQGRPESYWRQTVADARGKVRELENEGNVLVLKLNDLQNRFYRESDGFRQQDLQREISKTIYEQDLNKEKAATAKSQLDDLLKEARKSGALPGWLEERSSKP